MAQQATLFATPAIRVAFTIFGPPRTKKTHNRLVGIGKKCPVCGQFPTHILLPSETFEEWQKQAMPQVIKARLAVNPVGIKCLKCEGKGRVGKKLTTKCPRCLGSCVQITPLPRIQYNCAALIYRDRESGDTSGFIQAIADCMELSGLIDNDVQLATWDGTKPLKDATHPRVEITLTPAVLP